MWSTAQRHKKIHRFKTINQFAMANSVCWHGHVLNKEDSHALRRAVGFVAEGKGGKGG